MSNVRYQLYQSYMHMLCLFENGSFT